MLKLKLQYSGYLMQRTGSLEKTLMLGKIEAGGEGEDRGWNGLDSITDSMDTNLSNLLEKWGTEEPGVLQSMGSRRVRRDLATEQQQ